MKMATSTRFSNRIKEGGKKMENTMVVEKEQLTGEDYSDSFGEIKAALAACEEDDGSNEKEVLRLFFEVRTAFAESLPSPAHIRKQLSSTDRGITGHYHKYGALDRARQKLSEFCQAFDEHPDVYRRLEPQLKTIVQATAKNKKNGSEKYQVSAH
jgi:hypothetical protein